MRKLKFNRLHLLLFFTVLITQNSTVAKAPKKFASLLTKAQLSVAQAEMIADTCVTSFQASKKTSIAVTVFDTAGSLLAFRRMDGVATGIVETAMNKGRGAALFGFTTREMRNWAISNPSVTLLPGFSGLTGGVPIKTPSGELLGGVGVSGASSDEDEACAINGIRSVEQFF